MAVWRSTAVISHPALGGNGTNTWHCRTTFEVLPVAPLLVSAGTALNAFYSGCMDVFAGGASVSHDGVWVRVDGESAEIEDVAGWTVSSGTSTATLPPANCMVVSWRTAVATRRARGRTFIGPIGVNALQADGTPAEASRTALDGHAEALVTASAAPNDWALGVWSGLDEVLRDFTAASTANEFAVLRSRRD